MGLQNPQGEFENAIFGPNGMHPTPATLPYPTQPMKTIYGETVEYLIPDGQKEKVLKKLYPFGDPPPMASEMMDIHAKKTFRVSDFKVIEQNGYVMPVSPFFAEDGASVVDWQAPGDADGEEGVHISCVPDEVSESAYSAGYADGFTGMPEGTARPAKSEGMSDERYAVIEGSYDAGYADGLDEREANASPFAQTFTDTTSRRLGRRPRRA